MSTILSQDCPLCDKVATYEIVHDPFGKRFACPSCAEFFIDSSSERYLSKLPEVTKTETREKLRKIAESCPSDQLFVIREPRSDERGGDGHGVARTEMVAQCLSPRKAQ